MACEVLHDYCKGCKNSRLAEKEGPKDRLTGEPSYKAGDFIIRCNGIPGDDKFIPQYDVVAEKLKDPAQVQLAQAIYDPVIWAEKYLNWKPRVSRDGVEFQKIMLRCSSNRKVFRLGRRLGKSEIMAVKALHFLYNNSPKSQRWDAYRQEWVQGFGTIMVVTPFLSQVKNIFGRIKELIEMNPELKAEVKRSVATPFHSIELHNGSKILGFSAGANGAESVRGQKADFIILDEMDYLDESSIEAVLALLMEHSEVDLLCASTPSGRREYFYRFCRERMDFKEFHYSSDVNPSWSPQMEAELREFYNTEAGWQHEIMAEFGEAVTSVFQHKYVSHGRANYRYEELIRNPEMSYSIGIDWNDQENGTKIVVTGWHPTKQYFQVVQKETIQKVGWTQTAAIEALINLNRIWQPDYVYVDQGYGATQIEVIKRFGLDAKYSKRDYAQIDARLANVVGINSSSKVEVLDPTTGEKIKKPMKPFMVENAVRRFEQGIVQFSIYDEELYQQLIGYSVAKVNASGMPVYEAGPHGDHDLDALVLSLLAFQMETSELMNPEYNAAITFSGNFGDGKGKREVEGDDDLHDVLDKINNPKPRTNSPQMRSGYNKASKVGLLGGPRNTTRTYSPEAFNNDDRGRASSTRAQREYLKQFRQGLKKRGGRSF